MTKINSLMRRSNRAHRPTLLLMATLLLMVVFLAACGKDDAEKDLKETSQLFGEAWFNFDFSKAEWFCSPDSRRWIEFHASNIRQEDLDVYNEMGQRATCDVEHVELVNDSTVTVVLSVHDFLQTDSIDRPARLRDNAQVRITLKGNDGGWMVDLAEPLRVDD